MEESINHLLTGLLGLHKEIRSMIFFNIFVRLELARAVNKNEGSVLLSRERVTRLVNCLLFGIIIFPKAVILSGLKVSENKTRKILSIINSA